jgi:hypothetical protein
MSERTQEIKIIIPNRDGISGTDVTIRFVFNESWNIVRIEGIGPQHTYEGRLTLKGTALNKETTLNKESGDHCLICPGGNLDCYVEVPCTC